MFDADGFFLCRCNISPIASASAKQNLKDMLLLVWRIKMWHSSTFFVVIFVGIRRS